MSDSFLVQRVLQEYTDTYGGLRDANKLTSLSVEGVQIQDEQEYPFLIRKKRPDSIRYRLEKGTTTLITGYNGRKGWLQTSIGGEKKVEDLRGEQLMALREEARFEGPLYRHLEKPENEVLLDGRSWVGGFETYVIRVVEGNGSESLYYLDVRNSHILRVDRLHENGEIRLQTLYRNYKTIGGYPFAHEVENRIEGETVSLFKIDTITVNPGILSFYFEVPR